MNFKVGDKVKFKSDVLNTVWFHEEPNLSIENIYTVMEIFNNDIVIDAINENKFSFTWFELAGVKETKNKLLWTLLPFKQLEYAVQVMMFGAKKYSVDNWHQCNPEDYKEACMRHLTAFFNGEWLDHESNLPHLAHLICNALFLLWFKDNEKE